MIWSKMIQPVACLLAQSPEMSLKNWEIKNWGTNTDKQMVYQGLRFGLWCKFYVFEAKLTESGREVIKENSYN